MKKMILLSILLVVVLNAVRAQTLAARYDFNNNADDATGNHHATLMNGASFTSDRFGNDNSAVLLDGVNDFLDISNAASLQFDTYTFEA